MPTAFAFRLSVYLTLALSIIALGYSEWDYLREVTVFSGFILLAMLLAFEMDRRGRHLSLFWANLVGGIIFLLAAVWLGRHYFEHDSLMNTLPWPAGGLPFLAPLLMTLIVAKLLRPKHNGDWWALYGISLCCIGLAVSLQEDFTFVIIILIYAAVGTWSLTLFYFQRAVTDGTRSVAEIDRIGRRQAGRSLRWIVLAGLVAVPMFFLTPRTQGVSWELFSRGKIETGLPHDGTPDLSRTGQLTPSREIAFEVYASRPDGRPVQDLSPAQRWRSAAYVEYQSPRGLWTPNFRVVSKPLVPPTPTDLRTPTPNLLLPDFGPSTIRLDFRLVTRGSGLILADPVSFDPGGRTPVAIPLRNGNYAYAVQYWDTSFVFAQREFRFVNRYFQSVRGPGNDLSDSLTWFPLANPNDTTALYPFMVMPPEGIANHARRIFARLVADGFIPRRVQERRDATGRCHPADHAIVAQAFSDYLSFGGSYAYSLDLRRQDRSLDPVEDFLVNTRSGHCERFASALVLMLRTFGIPSQLVLGYRGLDPVNEGRYLIRHENAHAWAEVLVPKPDSSRREYAWLALDPTPGGSSVDNDEPGFLDAGARQGKRLLTDYIINLNPDTQKRLAETLTQFFLDNWAKILGGIAAITSLIMLVSWLRHRRGMRKAPVVDAVPWFTRLVHTLRRAGLPEIPGETPREFAERAAAWLQQNPGKAIDASVPLRAAELLYALRYAEQPVTQAEIQKAFNGDPGT